MVSIRSLRRIERFSFYGVASIALLKRTLTNWSEFWYMLLMFAISAITKYRMLPRRETD